ncbi:uncharacterized protein LOC127873286 [Dreissena polymorpha]|uniref:Uncharacterized protein n=1 Tax=Dreissena polymorpha TaxID=45954 RepID=A0A9D4L8P9_DREPO|nr:uncharacterized protein LOC127873286 [Dreissena polymorpha]KAH3853264.1 hypothetical protein DPMN_095786 [Dreissena polymorpha]
MAIGNTLSVSVGFLPEGRNDVPPPTNMACMPDIFNKLDADTIEKTRVLNSQLEMRLRVQERVLSKHRCAVEQRYVRERDRLRVDLTNIARRLPNYSSLSQLENKVKSIINKRNLGFKKHDCVFTTEPLDMGGLADEKTDKPFCDRFLTHHLPTKSKFYKDALPSVKKGYDGATRQGPALRSHRKESLRQGNVILKALYDFDVKLRRRNVMLKSLDDSYVKLKLHVNNEDDDTKTV